MGILRMIWSNYSRDRFHPKGSFLEGKSPKLNKNQGNCVVGEILFHLARSLDLFFWRFFPDCTTVNHHCSPPSKEI